MKELTLEQRINRQVNQLRNNDSHDPLCECENCLEDWHDDQHWPTLFLELPRNTHLLREADRPAGVPESFKVCGCYAEGRIRVCQDGDSPGAAVVRAWVAFTLGTRFVGEIIPVPFQTPGSSSVH
jgi:hypothetical protein